MNRHYQAARDGLKEIPSTYGKSTGYSIALATIQAQAALAVAEEQAKANQHLELGNLIAYAQLRRDRRHPSIATEELVDRRMSAFPEISEELAEDEDEL
jgi:hypothetical protein